MRYGSIYLVVKDFRKSLNFYEKLWLFPITSG